MTGYRQAFYRTDTLARCTAVWTLRNSTISYTGTSFSASCYAYHRCSSSGARYAPRLRSTPNTSNPTTDYAVPMETGMAIDQLHRAYRGERACVVSKPNLH